MQMGTPFLSRTHWLEILPEYGNENEKAFWICAFVRNYTAVAVPRGTEMSGGKTVRWMPVAALQL